jgi:hypothetical protein
MGLELLIVGLWVIQAIAAVVLAGQAAVNHRWFAAIGTMLGLAIGFLPFLLGGPAVWGPAILVTLVSVSLLIVAYGIPMRWKALIAVLLILGIPLGYRLFAYESFPPTLSPSFLGTLALLGEIACLLGPITCALASREVLGWLDRAIAIRRSA